MNKFIKHAVFINLIAVALALKVMLYALYAIALTVLIIAITKGLSEITEQPHLLFPLVTGIIVSAVGLFVLFKIHDVAKRLGITTTTLYTYEQRWVDKDSGANRSTAPQTTNSK